MPFSFGIPLGFLVILFGAVLLFATRNKKAGMLVIGIGAAIAVLTFLLILLAVNSTM